MEFRLETENLYIRKLNETDYHFILILLNSPNWIEFIGDRKVKTKSDALEYIKKGPLKSYIKHNFGLYLVEKKECKTSIGLCGLLKREELDFPDLGFAFLPNYTRKGYCYESVLAVLDFAKKTSKDERICAITDKKNAAATALLSKVGFEFKKNILFGENKEEEELLYFEKINR